jgi:4-amino-4-deoxy-L-arabinose transferase-like glycosyltransferase
MVKQIIRLSTWLMPGSITAIDHPNRLAAPAQLVQRPRPAKVLLALLVLTCFIPRAITAWRLDGICPDGVAYVQMAQALERGDLEHAFRLQLNVYPAILAALHQLGLSWEIGGRVWGLLVSTLVVLPLFGWVRRQFDDRLAVVACLLYAGHPELIEWSPEIIRDPTFWLLLALSLYLLWRAAAELSFTYYALAGLSIALAVLTRFEGLFLLVPLLGWSIARWLALRSHWPRLTAGVVVSLAVLPLALHLGNQACSGRTGRTEVIRLEQLNRARKWITAWWSPPKTPVPAMAATSTSHRESQPGGAVRWTTGKLLWSFVHQGERGLSPLYALLLLAGCLTRPRLLFRSDQLPMLVLSLLICSGIWIHIWYFHISSGRYFLPIALLSTPTIGLGLTSLVRGVRRVLASRRAPRTAWRLVPVASLAALLVIGWADALTTNIEPRIMNIRLGQWIGGRFGKQPTILGVDDQLPVVAHYAHGVYWSIPVGLSDQALVDMVRRQHPDVVIFSRRHSVSECGVLMSERRQLGLEAVEQLPDVSKRFVVLARCRLER